MKFAAPLAIGLAVVVAENATTDTLLRQSPFLMTHDSGTGYIGVSDIRRSFAMTQTIGLVDHLNCGARALDIRLAQTAYNGGYGTRRRKINYHHGKIPAWISDQSLDSTVPGLVEWAKEHPEEIVMLVTSHTYHKDSVGILAGNGHMADDSALMNTIKSKYEEYGVKWEFDCNTVNSWTLEEARAAALMSNGGRMIVLNEDCMSDYYDKSVDKASEVRTYAESYMAKGRSSSTMFTIQSFVQQAGNLDVPLNADLNNDVLSWIDEGLYNGVNLLEVNNVCAYGPSIAKKLGTTVSSEDATACAAACAAGCRKYGDLPGCSSHTVVTV